jgi:toxin FitB
VSGLLLDANVPSELINRAPETRVRDWVDAQDDASLHMSVVSVGELR